MRDAKDWAKERARADWETEAGAEAFIREIQEDSRCFATGGFLGRGSGGPAQRMNRRLLSYAERIETARTDFLFDDATDADEPVDEIAKYPLAEQHFLLALSTLEAAERHMKLAALYMARKQ